MSADHNHDALGVYPACRGCATRIEDTTSLAEVQAERDALAVEIIELRQIAAQNKDRADASQVTIERLHKIIGWIRRDHRESDKVLAYCIDARCGRGGDAHE